MSHNVYADLGYSNVDEMLFKAQLVSKIAGLIQRRRLTQVDAAKLLGCRGRAVDVASLQ